MKQTDEAIITYDSLSNQVSTPCLIQYSFSLFSIMDVIECSTTSFFLERAKEVKDEGNDFGS